MTDATLDHAPWPARAAILAGLGAAAGLLISLLLTAGQPDESWTKDVLRLAGVFFLGTAGILFAFTLERLRWTWSAAFALLGGLVVAGTYYWNGAPNDWEGSEGWRMVSALLAVIIAAPLFQTMRDEGARRLPTDAVHTHAWTNVVLWCVAWLFVAIAFALVFILAQLFGLVGLNFLSKLLERDWFDWMLVGAALGGVLGILRDRDRLLGTLQRIAMAILAVLAPILAAGLVFFLVALVFTGLSSLWEQTRSTTPILLSCIAGAIILANAVIDNIEEEPRGRVLRWSAMALAGSMLPLAIIALVSTSKRIGQYGYTPSRLWAMTFVIVAIICACGYLFALVRGRRDWARAIGPVNVRLALFICALSFVLATPIVSFGAISTRDQVARLETGKVSPDKFDWAALRFDFGPSGERAVQRLAEKGKTPEIRKFAADALKSEDRYAVAADTFEREAAEKSPATITVLPKPVELPADLRQIVLSTPPARENLCFGEGTCSVVWSEGASIAVVVHDTCGAKGVSRDQGRICGVVHFVVEKTKNGWKVVSDGTAPNLPETNEARLRAGFARGAAEVRKVERRQLFVGGEPVGDPFE